MGLPIILVYKKAFITKKWFTLWIIIAITFCYSIIIYSLFNYSSNYLVFRQTRVLVTTSLLPIVIYLFPLKVNDKLLIVLGVLFLNALAIIAEILFPQLQLYLAPIYMFNKGIKYLRAFGLTAGYDSAGYLSVMGFILASLFIIYQEKKAKYFIISLVFIASVFFTSRTSMSLIIAFVIFFAFYFIIFKRGKTRLIGVFFVFIIFFGITYFLLIVTNTFDFSLSKSFIFEPNIEYTRSFARTNFDEWKSHTTFFPDNEYLLLFGEAIDPPSDMGYIKVIYMIGLFGLFLVLIAHLYFIVSAHNVYKRIFKLMKLAKNRHLYFDKNSFSIAYWALIIFVLLQLIINLKNLYFYTRGYYELLIILFFILCSFAKQIRE